MGEVRNESELVLVTGASGYIGSHIVANLLSKGRKVRATVRDTSDPDRVDHIRSMEVPEGGSLEIVEMDLLDGVSVHRAVSGCSSVIHTAAVVVLKSKKPQEKIVDPSVIGTKNVLDAIDASGTVERLVHTSSTAAIRPQKWKDGQTLTTETWADDATIENNPYGLAKFSSERIVREWHEKKDSSRTRMVTINPCVVLGPPLSKRHLNGSISFVMTLLNREIPAVVPMHISIVDVRDVAEAHVRALTQGDNAGRYLVVSGQMWFKDIAKSLKKANPDLRIPTWQLPYSLSLLVSILHPKISLSWARTHLGRRLFWDASPTEKDLGMEWMNPEQSLLETVPPILENEWLE
ncbi:MAG TPA: NAD-dependent epimerase/dehydratase family protein [Candidatus Thalassarchaeaceae archaeon]|jgi:dihydroflavonol-4-reductase|nr:NAD-dependent epimerase/dehydratase family protein [Candidatus Thalassarchaeaceae archaeon]|tara:strand:- start:1139 stop:2185 length:1047 start_codon:yes stop_codon:yes gene_type:complete